MNYLLDTHTLLWILNEEVTLSASAIDAIENLDNEIFVSVASLWEIRIKQKLNKLQIPENFIELLSNLRVNILHINEHHANAIMQLQPIHRDPFDWMLIAQCMVEGFTFITRDKYILQYNIPILPA